MEEHRVEVGQSDGVLTRVLPLDFFAVQLVTVVQSAEVALDRLLAVHHGKLGAHVRLVKVVGVPHTGCSETTVEHEWCIRTYQDGYRARTTRRSGATCGIYRIVSCNDQGESTVPGAALHPRDGIEESGGAAVAGIGGVRALDIGATVRLEELHQHSFHRLALVDDGLGAYFQSADVLRLDFVTFQQPRSNSEAQRVDVLTIVTETHSRLTQADRVLARRHAVVRLQFRLLHVLRREVDL